MKLKDCDCGAAVQVKYDIQGNKKFIVGCMACGNQTPSCDSIEEAASSWNQIYCCTAPHYETDSS